MIDNDMTSAKTEESNNLNSSEKSSAKNDNNISIHETAYFIYEIIIGIGTAIFIIYYAYISYTQNLDDFTMFKDVMIGTVKLLIIGFLLLRIIMKIADIIDSKKNNN